MNLEIKLIEKALTELKRLNPDAKNINISTKTRQDIISEKFIVTARVYYDAPERAAFSITEEK